MEGFRRHHYQEVGPDFQQTHSPDSAILPDFSRSTLSNALSDSYLIGSMSMSPISNGQDNSSKRRRTEEDFGYSRGPMDLSPQPGSASNGHGSQAIPKRGQRACTACRKGKNRCEGEVCSSLLFSLSTFTHWPALPVRPGIFCAPSQAPCRRCQLAGTPCVFEKPDKKTNAAPQMSTASVEYVPQSPAPSYPAYLPVPDDFLASKANTSYDAKPWHAV